MVTSHVWRHTCFRFPTGTSHPHLWTFPKQYVLPGILFLQAVKWPFPSFKQLLKSHQSSSLLRLIGQLTGLWVLFDFVFVFFFFLAQPGHETPTAILPSLIMYLALTASTLLKYIYPFFISVELFWSKIGQKVMSAPQTNSSYIQDSEFYP